MCRDWRPISCVRHSREAHHRLIRQAMTPPCSPSPPSLKYGWGYMTQYMKQEPKFVQGHINVARSLASGASLVSFDANVSSTFDVQHRAGGKIILAGLTYDLLPVSFSAEELPGTHLIRIPPSFSLLGFCRRSGKAAPACIHPVAMCHRRLTCHHFQVTASRCVRRTLKARRDLT